MKKSNPIISFFFISWSGTALFLLTRNINFNLLKLCFYSLGAGFLLTLLYLILRRPLLQLYLQNFDKDYKYTTARKKNRSQSL